jgi:gliding motility-associated-like protein
MRATLILLFLFCTTIAVSQGIEVDTTSMSIPDLVRNELLQNACAEEGNFLFSSRQGIGKFSSSNPNFPFQDGIILRNGIAKYTEGLYTGINESSQLNKNGDPDLQFISNSNGQSTPITDVSFLQFDFTPLSSTFSFDFLFASNEYGEFQCGFSDIFAFVLTDLTTGSTTNLAVVPNTSLPVSVLNIRDEQYNSSCLSANPELFAQYNLKNPANSFLNMRGETKVLTASSAVIPNRTYRIKLAIGDYNDSNYDSAVLIKGGSFKTTMDLGPDRSICEGEQLTIETKLTGNFAYSWSRNGVIIPGQTGATLLITQPGTYEVTATLSGCVIKDEVVINQLLINTPTNLVACYRGVPTYSFDLTQNSPQSLGLDPNDYTINYFASLAAATANDPVIPQNQLTTYTITSPQTIYIKIVHKTNNNSICNDFISFDLQTNPPLSIINPPNLLVCETASGFITADLTLNNNLILNGLPSNEYTFSYYLNLLDANNKTNEIKNPINFSMSSQRSPLKIWVRIENKNQTQCYTTSFFDLIVIPLLNVDQLPDVVACDTFILPNITNGRYYSGPNGTGISLNIGDTITQSGTYYIYNFPSSSNNCPNESSFRITLVKDFIFSNQGCGQYSVPAVLVGDFFTEPNGGGNKIPSGTVLSNSQIIYYFAVINGIVCRDEAVPITVFPLPEVDQLSDVVTCNSFTLPILTHGKYYTLPGGNGITLTEGNAITATQTLYIYANDGQCSNESHFLINIIDTTLFGPISRCGEYILPNIPIGGYYDQPKGQGNLIPEGTKITSSKIVYYYATTTTTPNCTDNLKIDITIKPLPLIDKPNDVLSCTNYILPNLTNGNYFTLPNGGGQQVAFGTILSTTQTLYVFKSGPDCSNEHAFTITIRSLPVVDNFTDILSCESFLLPKLKNGTYYTASGGPNGQGIALNEGTLITTSQTLFIYNEWADFKECTNESFFKVTIKKVEVGTFNNIITCDSYTLPPLATGNYFLSPNGKDPIAMGTVLNQSQKIYVYAEVGNRITCTSETSFLVTISNAPKIEPIPTVLSCLNYRLPPLTIGEYYSGPNKTGTLFQAGTEITTNQKMYIYAASVENPNCFSEISFNITIFPLRDIAPKKAYVCIEAETGNILQPAFLDAGLDPSQYNVRWYLEGNLIAEGPNYSATKEGIYTLEINKISPNIGSDCGYNSTTYTVEKSSPAAAKITVSDAFTDSIDLIVTLSNGLGSYEFKIDDGNFQTSNIFFNVDSGEHTLTIKDVKGGCDDRILIANVLKYPKFFTPNNDGYHDTWNIDDLAFQPNAIIRIFDRYGKFIKEIKPSGPGWDGFYNGNPLPSTDYWFQVFYILNEKEQIFKSHFSMKR